MILHLSDIYPSKSLKVFHYENNNSVDRILFVFSLSCQHTTFQFPVRQYCPLLV